MFQLGMILQVGEAMKKCKKGTFDTNFRVILDSLYSMPFVSLTGSKVHHEIDEVSGSSVGAVHHAMTTDCFIRVADSAESNEHPEQDAEN